MRFGFVQGRNCECTCFATGTGTGNVGTGSVPCPCLCDAECLVVTISGVAQNVPPLDPTTRCKCSEINGTYFLQKTSSCNWDSGEIIMPFQQGCLELCTTRITFNNFGGYSPPCDYKSVLSVSGHICIGDVFDGQGSWAFYTGDGKFRCGPGTSSNPEETLTLNNNNPACTNWPTTVTIEASDFCFPTGTGTFGTGSPIKDCENFVCVWEWEGVFWQRIFYGCPAFFDQGGPSLILCDCIEDPPITGNEIPGEQFWRACNDSSIGT